MPIAFRAWPEMTTLLDVRDLKVHFPLHRGRRDGLAVKAVDGISFSVDAGKTVALVGESGCGKSTTAYAVLGLTEATSGQILFDGRDITGLDNEARRGLTGDIQIVFQDPSAALNPRLSVGQSIAEPLAIAGHSQARRRTRVAELIDRVGLPQSFMNRLPSALSGGQRQRVVIARALALSPRLLILDEPVSSLDVSIRSQILNLLLQLQRDLKLTYLFISHDLSVVRHIADEAIVLYLGTIAERGPIEAIFDSPQHPYTQALLSAIPLPDPAAQRSREKIILTGELPSPINPPAGCTFVGRCPIRVEACATLRPKPATSVSGSQAACIVRVPASASVRV
jgi:oligopeptide/dipeptide ABC transporter ATP-binding protein